MPGIEEILDFLQIPFACRVVGNIHTGQLYSQHHIPANNKVIHANLTQEVLPGITPPQSAAISFQIGI